MSDAIVPEESKWSPAPPRAASATPGVVVERYEADGFAPCDRSWKLAPIARLWMPVSGDLTRMASASVPVEAGALVVRRADGTVAYMVSPDRTQLFVPGGQSATLLTAIAGVRVRDLVELPWLSEHEDGVSVVAAKPWGGWMRLVLAGPLFDEEASLCISTVDNRGSRPVPTGRDGSGDGGAVPSSPCGSVTAANAECARELCEGWHGLWLKLVAKLAFIEPEPVVAWARPKFAELRVAWVGTACERAEDAVEGARLQSICTCEVCGEPGGRRTWPDMVVATRCDRHPWSTSGGAA